MTMPQRPVRSLRTGPAPPDEPYRRAPEIVEDGYSYREEDVWWSELTPPSDGLARVGLVHGTRCLLMIVRPREGGGEIVGPPRDLKGLAVAVLNAIKLSYCLETEAVSHEARAAG